LAADFGQLEVFKMMFVAVDEKSPLDTLRYTPFHYAAMSGRLDVCKFIIENKVDPNIRGTDGETPLHLAAQSGHLTAFKFLFHVVNNKNPLTDFKCTPLHYAAESGHVEVCKFILENVEDSLNSKNDDGKTPLDEAREEGQEKVYNFLKLYEDLHKHPAKRPRFSICEKYDAFRKL
jgi:ankyrin repeat protein